MKKNFRKISGVLLLLFMLQNIFGGYSFAYVSANESVLPANGLNIDAIISPDSADITPPVADLSTLHVSQKTAVPGDTVKIKIKASDVGSGINFLSFDLDNENGGRLGLQTVSTADAEGYYTLSFKVSDITHNGRWYITGLRVFDNNSNVASYYRSSTDFSAADFVVMNDSADITPPVADLSTLHVSQKTAVPGDTVKIKIKASDVGSGIKFLSFDLDNENGGRLGLQTVSTADAEGYYTLSFKVSDITHNGRWYITGLRVFDNNSNVASYYRSSTDFSAADFVVEELIVPENKINAEYITKNTTWNYKTVDRDVYVGPDAILTINGDVKINGDLYILGAVISYGKLSVPEVNARSIYYGSSSTVNQGSLNIRGGTHYISSFIVSTYPITQIPIEIYSDNEVTEDRVLPVLEGATLPIGDLYIEGEKIDYYYNGTFSIPNYFVGSKKSLELKVIDIFRKEHIFTYELNNLNQRELLNIELISPPDKMQYVVGQNLDLTGIEVVVNYDDGSSESIQISEEHISGFNSATSVTGQIVMITVGEKNITFMVDIVEKTLESIEVTKTPTDIVYIVGQEIDISGLEVMGTYNDGSKEVLDITLGNISGFDSSAPVAGQIISVTVNGKNTSFTVDIIENSLVSIEITDLPLKLSYYEDDLLDIHGLEVTGTYLDGSKAVLEVTETNVSGFNSSSPEMGQILTVSVEGKTDAFSIDILENRLTGIEITSLPEKLDYIEGQPLDLAGLEVSGTYMNGKKAVLEVTEANITGFDSTVVTARQVLTVTVENKSADFEISIIEKVLTNVVLQTYPMKISYYVGEKFRLEGLVLYGTYNDSGSEKINSSEVSVQGFDSSIPFKGQTVTLSIGQWKFEFLVDILPEPALKVLAGDNRYRTATRISSETYERADTVILVQANNFPDALAAGPLAYMLNAPILLTSTGRLSGATQEEMERLGAKKVIIMGGEIAVSSDVAEMLLSAGYKVERLEGSNRYSTAVITAELMETLMGIRNTVVLASGTQFADALAAGSYAAREGFPIILTDGNRLTKTTMDHITESGVDRIIIVGGTTVISEALESELKAMGITITRKSGKNRFDTSLEIAKSFFGNAEKAVVANGMEFADALAAAPYAAKMGAPILLVNQSRINLPIKEYLPGSMIDSIIVVGGEAAVGNAVRSELEELLR